MAAVLACGPTAVLSHTSAGRLWGMLRTKHLLSPAESQRTASHVTVSGNARRRPGIVIHRSRTLLSAQATRHLGIPVTTPSRTLEDLRRTLPRPQFAAALRQAEFLGLPLAEQLGPDGTRSELESRFLALCRRHHLPKPDVNLRVGGFVVDFAWSERRLIVEVDGWDTHRTRAAFEDDRARDLKLKLLGYESLRFTWRQLTDEPAAVAAALRELLRK